MKKLLLSAGLLLMTAVGAMASDNTDQATTNYTETQWEYYAATEYDGGTGTADDPYLIATVEQFMKLAVEIENKAADDENWEDWYSDGKYWKQTADLVFNEDVLSRVVFALGDASSLSSTDDLRTFTGVGYYLDSNDFQVFAGTYDGDGHSISGLYISNSSNKSIGLFNNLQGGTVKNLIVKDAYLTANANVGLIAGKVEEGSAIYNCQTSGIIYCGGSYHAGIAGYVDASKVYNCNSDAWLWAKNQDAGIAGRGSHSAEFDNCFFNGWIGAVATNVAKFTAWGAIVSELGTESAEETYVSSYTYDENGVAVDSVISCDNPSTARDCYWMDTCTVRHLSSATVAAVDPTLSTVGKTENCVAVSADQLSATVEALNTTAATLDDACGWELDENNRPVLTFVVSEDNTEGGEDTDGITSVAGKTAGSGACYYTLGGLRLSSPVSGVNIVRYSDGKTVKVMK